MLLNRARVTNVTENGEIYVEVPNLGVGQDFGPCEVASGSFEVGDRVLVGQIEVSEDVVIVAKMNASTNDDPGGGGGIRAFYSDTEPFATGIGDLWINSGNSNILNFYNGEEWVPVRDSGIEAAITIAQTAQALAGTAADLAGNAQTAANNAALLAGTKNRSYHQDEPPPSTYLVEGDLWIDSNNGNRLHRWFNNGAGYEWMPVLFAGQAIEFGSIGEDQLDPSLDIGSDGDPPTVAPVVTASAFAGGVNLRWASIPNHDPVTFEVYAMSTSGGARTLVMETSSTYAPIREIGGTPLTTSAPTYFVVIPKDEDGVGPESNEVSATARKLTQAEIDDAFTDFLNDIEQTAQEAHQNAENAVQTFYRSTAPTNPTDNLGIGDLWFDTSSGNHPYRWDGDSWESIKDEQTAQAAADAFGAATDAMDAAIAAQATADGAIRTYYQSSPPWPNGSTQPPEVVGDMWFDLDNGQAYRWNGSNWQVITDNAIAEALAAAQNAQTTADGKITAWYQTDLSVAPTAAAGDILFRTDLQNRMYRLAGSPLAWVPMQQKSPDEINDDLGEAIDQINAIEITANGKNRIYWSAEEPPAVGTFVDGDVWFQKDSSTLQIIKMWQYDNNETMWFEQELADAMFANLDVLGHLQAGSIGTEYLLVGDFTNQAVNPSFEYGDGFAGWEGKNAFTNADTSTKRTGNRAMRFTGTATLKTKAGITVEEGDQLLFTVWYRTSTTVTPSNMQFTAFDQNANELTGWDVLSNPNFGATPTTSWVRGNATLIVGSGITEVYPAFKNTDNGQTTWIDDVAVRRKGTGELIVDGSILATALQADSITGDQINTEWLDALTVKANNVEAGFFTSDIALSAKLSIQEVGQDAEGNLIPVLTSNIIEMDSVNGMVFKTPTSEFEDDGVTPVYKEILNLPLDVGMPAVWKGQVKTEQVTSEIIEMTGDAHPSSGDPVYSTIATGSTLRLDNTIEDPKLKPEVVFRPNARQWPPSQSFVEVGLGHYGSLLVQGKLTEVASDGVYRLRGRYVNPATGALDHDDNDSWPFYAVGGFTCTGGKYFVLYKLTKGGDPWSITRFDRSWQPESTILVDDYMGGGHNTGCLGDAGRNDCVAFAYRDNNNEIHIRYYTLDLTNHTGITNRNPGTTTVRRMVGVPDVDVVAAGNRFMWFKGGGAIDQSKSWDAPSAMTSAAYLDGNYISTDGAGEMAIYNNDITDDTLTLRTAYTKLVWSVSGATPVVDKESKMSPVLSVKWPTRMFARITAPDLVPGTNGAGLYASTVGSARTNLRQLPKLPSILATLISKAPTTGANPPLTSGFDGGSSFPGAFETKVTIPGSIDKPAVGIYGDGTAVMYGLKAPSTKRRCTISKSVSSGGPNFAWVVDWNVGPPDPTCWERDIFYSSTNNKFAITQAGRYRVVVQMCWQSTSGGAVGYRGMCVYVNDVEIDRGIVTATANQVSSSKYEGELLLAKGDNVSFGVYQNSGSDLGVRTTAIENYAILSRMALA